MRTIENLSVLVIGCGSIGARHASNLASLGVKSIGLCDTDHARSSALSAELRGIETTTFTSIKQALDSTNKNQPQIAIIATPSSKHINHALICARSGLDILIEKPLSDSLDGSLELIEIVDKANLVVMVAMCYRFHPVFLRLKELLDSSIFGPIYHVNYYGGHYLPDWHPGADYRKEYASNKKLGGGVVLTSIHGIDNIRWLFGEVCEVAAYTDHVSDMEMDVEDMALSIMKTKKGIYISHYTDFLNRKNQHRINITATLGTITCDFLSGRIEYYNTNTGKLNVESIDYDINSMYTNEMAFFLRRIADRARPSTDLKDALHTLRLALGVKKSSSEKRFISL